ncbi:hypothetical protein HELRODRAFT_179242 [Helobdella robusta]|uniref:EF-hand domain-containing protein n=1 Tax=Helobdella robusta TaxID=6412 RepID=T1FEF0_HELRO|nr:hypothetical protein HELRODRAFT_179242 [Helobdella robusta]ESN95473.1 hypothetical protein HELRODRAFT_179242 [Helobdella robusta]
MAHKASIDSTSSDATMEDLAACFDLYDKDKNGYLDRKEITIVVKEFLKADQSKKKLSKSEIDKEVKMFINMLDTNNDNKISKQEFMDFFAKHMKQEKERHSE